MHVYNSSDYVYVYDSEPDEDLWPPGELGKHLSELEKVFTCGICKDFMSNPQILPCQHSYCMECINRCMDTVLWQNARKECPTCRKECVPTQCKPNTYLSAGIVAFRSARKLLLEQLHQPLAAPEPVPVPQIVYVYRDAPTTSSVDKNGSAIKDCAHVRVSRGKSQSQPTGTTSAPAPSSSSAAAAAAAAGGGEGGGGKDDDGEWEGKRKSGRKRKTPEAYAAYDVDVDVDADGNTSMHPQGRGKSKHQGKGRGKGTLDDVYDAYDDIDATDDNRGGSDNNDAEYVDMDGVVHLDDGDRSKSYTDQPLAYNKSSGGGSASSSRSGNHASKIIPETTTMTAGSSTLTGNTNTSASTNTGLITGSRGAEISRRVTPHNFSIKGGGGINKIKEQLRMVAAGSKVVPRMDGDEKKLKDRYRDIVHGINAQVGSANGLTLDEVIRRCTAAETAAEKAARAEAHTKGHILSMTSSDKGFQKMISDIKSKNKKQIQSGGADEAAASNGSGIGIAPGTATGTSSGLRPGPGPGPTSSAEMADGSTVNGAPTHVSAGATRNYSDITITIDNWIVLPHKSESINGPFFYNIDTQVGQFGFPQVSIFLILMSTLQTQAHETLDTENNISPKCR